MLRCMPATRPAFSLCESAACMAQQSTWLSGSTQPFVSEKMLRKQQGVGLCGCEGLHDAQSAKQWVVRPRPTALRESVSPQLCSSDLRMSPQSPSSCVCVKFAIMDSAVFIRCVAVPGKPAGESVITD